MADRQTRSQTSLSITLTPYTINTLDTLREEFNNRMEIDGNDFLYPIQNDHQARQTIGAGSLTHALMVLIGSHLAHVQTIMEDATDQLDNIAMSGGDWLVERAIASHIIRNCPNTQDLENIINDDHILSIHCHLAAQQYGTLPENTIQEPTELLENTAREVAADAAIHYDIPLPEAVG